MRNLLNIKHFWTRFWMHYADSRHFGRIATKFAGWFVPPYKSRCFLAYLNSKGYISPSADLYHDGLELGKNIFIGDRVTIYKAKDGGPVIIGNRTCIHRDTIIETGHGGSLKIGNDTSIQPRCQFSAYKGSIIIGHNVQIAPNCAFYPYNHGFAVDGLIKNQPLQTKGGITIEDDVWLGFGVIVLDGVKIGTGAVIGAGSVVTHDIPDGAIAVGVPARVVKMRADTAQNEKVKGN